MSDYITNALRAAAVGAVAAVGLIATGGYFGYRHIAEEHTSAALTERAQDSLRNRSLTPVAMEKFSRNDAACDASRPYGANFVAEGADGKVVRGHVCSAPNRDNVFKFNP